jgi:hypothetical protein
MIPTANPPVTNQRATLNELSNTLITYHPPLSLPYRSLPRCLMLCSILHSIQYLSLPLLSAHAYTLFFLDLSLSLLSVVFLCGCVAFIFTYGFKIGCSHIKTHTDTDTDTVLGLTLVVITYILLTSPLVPRTSYLNVRYPIHTSVFEILWRYIASK